MTFKDILVYADTNKAAPVCLNVAADLAAAHKAHLVALHVVSLPYVPVDISGGVPAQVIQWQEDFEREQAAKAKLLVAAAEQRNGQNIEWRCVDTDTDIVDTALLHSRYADLVVIGQGADQNEPSETDNLAEALVMGSGRPALIVPSFGKFGSIGQRVLIAWTSTREAARALHDAMPILARAESVTVMEVNPETGKTPRIAGADIAAHLARHGVKTDVSSTVATDIEVGDAILSRAADLGSDLLVMGAYGHSRLREFAFGGATRHLLQYMTIPVFMSH